MIASAHMVAGAAAGLAGARVAGTGPAGIASGFVLGVASHHVLDAVPHSDYAALSPLAIRLVATIEVLVIGAALLWLARGLTRGHAACLCAGVAGGAVMDVTFFQPLVPRYADAIQRAQEWLHPFHAALPRSGELGFALELLALGTCAALLAWQARAARRT